MSLQLLKYPYPYKAWLTMANDPDNTTIEAWKELHGFIWEELEIPFGDSLFVSSFNQNLPDQVNLVENPEIGKAHLHDIIHTWGDYMHARKRGFDRDDAIEAAGLLQKAGIQPRVWIDHASFVGNMMHGTNKGAVPKLKDSSGLEYENFVYSLDIARGLGIRYIWNGEVTDIIGQDRDPTFDDEVKRSGGSTMKASVKSAFQYLPTGAKKFPPIDNRQYYPQRFADGSTLYCFRRYGTWPDADIDGLHNLISSDRIDALLRNGGTAIVYSHLGKRHPKGMDRPLHIPETTRNDLKNLSERFKSKELMLSATSELLDYLILRDHVEVSGNTIRFVADGIRYQTLTPNDLSGKVFSFKGNADAMEVFVDNIKQEAVIRKESDGIFSVVFQSE
ncbi:MAG: hypothetical protein GC178_10975 [Flavobacteriales bacterium]|nr:hypothetical protein [Flavobacteriales bacterium]